MYRFFNIPVFRPIRIIVISVSGSPSARTNPLRSHWTDISEIWYLWFLRKAVEKSQMWVKQDKKDRVFYIKTWVHVDFPPLHKIAINALLRDAQFNSSTISLQFEATNSHNYTQIAILQHGMENVKNDLLRECTAVAQVGTLKHT
jgi:hypothetical protein